MSTLSTFILHSKLEQDSLFICRLKLAQVRLVLDANYPWCLLIPEVNQVTELTDLTHQQFVQLQDESLQLQRAMQTVFKPDKMNIAMLGNIVNQLHIHHIARYQYDAAWPSPVWNVVKKKTYGQDQLTQMVELIQSKLTN